MSDASGPVAFDEGEPGRGSSERRERVTVVIPCFNEERGLAKVLAKIPPEVHEVLVLDNCSVDKTAEVASRAGGRVRLVSHGRNLGYGGSYIRGVPMARGSIIVTADGDGTYPVQDCMRLVDELVRGGYDFLSCARFPLQDRRGMSLRNRVGNAILTTLVNGFYGLRLRDAQSGMWVFRKEMFEKLNLSSTGMAFSNEIKIEAFTHPEIKAGEIHIPYAERIGRSKLYPFRDGVKMVGFLVRRKLRAPNPSWRRGVEPGPDLQADPAPRAGVTAGPCE